MLRTPAPYPHVGSYALLERDGANQLVRIVKKDLDDVLVAFPLLDGASGNTRVPFTDLLDATPLTQAERARMLDLSRARGGKRKAEYEALRYRDIHSHHLAELMADLARRTRRAAA